MLSGTRVITTLPMGSPRAVGVNPTSGYVYVVNSNDSVTVLSATQVITTLSIGSYPWAIGVNPVTGYVYVANGISNDVTVISGTQVVAIISTGHLYPDMIGVNPSSGYIYVTNKHSNGSYVTVLSGTEFITNLPVDGYPTAIGINPASGYIYVASQVGNDEDCVTVLSGTEVITTLIVGKYPSAIKVNPVSGYIYVANALSDYVTVLSGTQLIENLTVRGWPRDIAVNPANQLIYVTNGKGGSVSVIQELIVAAMTDDALTSSAQNIKLDFGEPVVTSTIHFAISPTLRFTVTWGTGISQQSSMQAAAYRYATITHDPFISGVTYALQIQPGGQSVAGVPVVAQSFRLVYWPYRRYLPLAVLRHL